MIEFVVNAYRDLIQILLFGGVALAAYIASHLIPDIVDLSEFGVTDPIEFNTFGKAFTGGLIAFLAEVIVFGPFLVLLDIREGVRSTEAKIAALRSELKDNLKDIPQQSSSISSIDNQIYAVHSELVKLSQQDRPLTGNNKSSAV